MNGVSRNLRLLLALGLFGILLTGCQAAAQPHITAKVIYQQDDIAAELSSEWH